MDAILIPLKRLGLAKNRLTSLSNEQKAQLQLAMLGDVIDSIPEDLPIYLVTAETKERLKGLTSRLKLVEDPGSGLNPAIARGWSEAVHDGAHRVVVVQGDIPMLESFEVERVLACSEQIVVAPSDDGGTSILSTKPPGVIDPAFGPDSAGRHVLAASERGLTTAVIQLEAGRFDVDDEDDLRRIAAFSGPRPLRSSLLAASILGLSSAGEAQAPARS